MKTLLKPMFEEDEIKREHVERQLRIWKAEDECEMERSSSWYFQRWPSEGALEWWLKSRRDPSELRFAKRTAIVCLIAMALLSLAGALGLVTGSPPMWPGTCICFAVGFLICAIAAMWEVASDWIDRKLYDE